MEAAAIDVSGMTASIVGQLGAFSPENMLIVVGAAIGASAGLVLGWFGVNYIKRRVSAALKKGRL